MVDALASGAGSEQAGSVVLTATFVIDGPPVPKARPQFNTKTGHAFTPKRTADYEKHVRASLGAQLLAMRSVWPLDARYVVSLDFYARNPLFADSDNLCKSVTDGAIGVLWDDDRTVDYGHIRRHHDPVKPRCEMRVEVIR